MLLAQRETGVEATSVIRPQVGPDGVELGSAQPVCPLPTVSRREQPRHAVLNAHMDREDHRPEVGSVVGRRGVDPPRDVVRSLVEVRQIDARLEFGDSSSTPEDALSGDRTFDSPEPLLVGDAVILGDRVAAHERGDELLAKVGPHRQEDVGTVVDDHVNHDVLASGVADTEVGVEADPRVADELFEVGVARAAVLVRRPSHAVVVLLREERHLPGVDGVGRRREGARVHELAQLVVRAVAVRADGVEAVGQEELPIGLSETGRVDEEPLAVACG